MQRPVISAFQLLVPGGACVPTTPLRPGHRNEFHAGLEQAFGKYLVIDGEYIWKYTHRAFDFSVVGNTPLTYPIEWTSSKIPGYALRTTVPNFHGLTAFAVASSVAARFFSPQLAGVGATPVGFGVFRIDHDELYNMTTHVQYQPVKNAPWISFNWRSDSGLVAGPVPCAGGACPNGPNGTDTVVDVSNLTPDQQFEGGLYCGSVHATPTTPISPTDLCPANMYGSSLVSIPAPGTSNAGHNPQRIAQRNLFDLGVGDDNLFHGDKHRWSARLTVVNLLNKEALYNFLSTFRRNSLCVAAGDHGHHRLPFLTCGPIGGDHRNPLERLGLLRADRQSTSESKGAAPCYRTSDSDHSSRCLFSCTTSLLVGNGADNGGKHSILGAAAETDPTQSAPVQPEYS